jgi:hypothetical protein
VLKYTAEHKNKDKADMHPCPECSCKIRAVKTAFMDSEKYGGIYT